MTEKPSRVNLAYRAAEQATFPRVPDDQIWCSVRNQLVGASDCATDACVMPEARPVCWEGHVSRKFELEHADG